MIVYLCALVYFHCIFKIMVKCDSLWFRCLYCFKVKVKYSMKITGLGKMLKFIANFVWIRFSSGLVSPPNKIMKFGVVKIIDLYIWILNHWTWIFEQINDWNLLNHLMIWFLIIDRLMIKIELGLIKLIEFNVNALFGQLIID